MLNCYKEEYKFDEKLKKSNDFLCEICKYNGILRVIRISKLIH